MVPTTTERTKHGTIRNGGIVLDAPLDLPEGTEVIVIIRAAAGEPPVHGTPYVAGGRTDITNEELIRLAEKYPPPKEWWDGGDDDRPRPSGDDEVQTSLTDEELHAWALAHPAPQSWWDETDNPFEPAPDPELKRPSTHAE